jgi:hypothetical protein
MTIARAGVSQDDPRNRGLIDIFRPVEYTPAELQARSASPAAHLWVRPVDLSRPEECRRFARKDKFKNRIQVENGSAIESAYYN